MKTFISSLKTQARYVMVLVYGWFEKLLWKSISVTSTSGKKKNFIIKDKMLDYFERDVQLGR